MIPDIAIMLAVYMCLRLLASVFQHPDADLPPVLRGLNIIGVLVIIGLAVDVAMQGSSIDDVLAQ